MLIKNKKRFITTLTLQLLISFFIHLDLLSTEIKNKSKSENSFSLLCQNGLLDIKLKGSKTKFRKLKLFITSEKKTLLNLNFSQAKIQIQKILRDTNLFNTVKLQSKKKNSVTYILKDTFTLLPIINFSTNLESFSYNIGLNESNLFHDAWRIGGSYSKSDESENIFFSTSLIQPTDFLQSFSLGGNKGDTFFYFSEDWFKIEREELYTGVNFKTVTPNYRLFYGLQLRYTDFSFLDDPTLSTSIHFSIGRLYQNHDLSHGFRFYVSGRYLDDEFNKYTFTSILKKNWYKPIKNNAVFRGYLLSGQIGYSLIEEELSAVGAIFSFRNSYLHGLRSNSVFSKNFYSIKSRIGITSKKFLWSYWQPHVFVEGARSDDDDYFSVGGGLLITFTPLFNSRLRIQYYYGDLPDERHGLIISTSMDF